MLASRFRNAEQISSSNPLSDDQLRRVAPSIFAAAPHESRSARYGYAPTIEVLSALRKEGFEPFFAVQTRTRDAGRREFTKHMLRLRHASQIALAEVPEIILLNSHDGSSSYQMIAGLFRFVCANGMVCGTSFGEVRVQHTGNIVGRVIEGAYSVVEEFGRVRESADSMKAITLAPLEQRAFGRAALVAKYGEEAAPINVEQVLQARRTEDAGADLWQTFNRVQENLVRGGIRSRSATGRRQRTREVAGITENVKLNRAIWTLAEEMKRIKN